MKRRIKKIVLLLCLLVLILIMAILISLVNNKSKSNSDSYIEEDIKLNFESRIDKLKTFDSGEYYKFAWIQIQGTNIDLPVLDAASSPNVKTINYSYSWMSPNYITGENRPVIMGHNILNVSNEPMLPDKSLKNFEELMAFSYYGFAKDNLYIEYTTENSDDIYLIYAIGFYDYNYDQSESLSSKDAIDKYIKSVKKNSIYDYNIDVNSSDDIITIKTCTRYFGANEKQQFIIEARKLRKDEKTVKYQVEMNNNYKKLNLKKENI